MKLEELEKIPGGCIVRRDDGKCNIRKNDGTFALSTWYKILYRSVYNMNFCFAYKKENVTIFDLVRIRDFFVIKSILDESLETFMLTEVSADGKLDKETVQTFKRSNGKLILINYDGDILISDIESVTKWNGSLHFDRIIVQRSSDKKYNMLSANGFMLPEWCDKVVDGIDFLEKDPVYKGRFGRFPLNYKCFVYGKGGDCDCIIASGLPSDHTDFLMDGEFVKTECRIIENENERGGPILVLKNTEGKSALFYIQQKIVYNYVQIIEANEGARYDTVMYDDNSGFFKLLDGEETTIATRGKWVFPGLVMLDQIEGDPYYFQWRLLANNALITKGDDGYRMYQGIFRPRNEWKDEMPFDDIRYIGDGEFACIKDGNVYTIKKTK